MAELVLEDKFPTDLKLAALLSARKSGSPPINSPLVGFVDSGIVVTPVVNSHDEATSIAIQADGKIIVAGYAYGDGHNVRKSIGLD